MTEQTNDIIKQEYEECSMILKDIESGMERVSTTSLSFHKAFSERVLAEINEIPDLPETFEHKNILLKKVKDIQAIIERRIKDEGV